MDLGLSDEWDTDMAIDRRNSVKMTQQGVLDSFNMQKHHQWMEMHGYMACSMDKPFSSLLLPNNSPVPVD
ncbi:hypothetical protein K3495_g9856 [Podosphaera aphanis]|nr:hypothetical protein K3495_g9856 [Podosphaera aphanis]